MGGEPRPEGATIRFKVMAKDKGSAVIEGDAKDFDYLKVGREYIARVMPVAPEHSGGAEPGR